MNEDQLDIMLKDDKITLEFPYNESFIEYLKARIPAADRSYDEDTRVWTVDEKYLNAIEGVATQKFQFVTRKYRNPEGQMVWRNVKTGAEMVQGNLF